MPSCIAGALELRLEYEPEAVRGIGGPVLRCLESSHSGFDFSGGDDLYGELRMRPEVLKKRIAALL